MNDFGLLYDALDLKSPWRVLNVRDDLRHRQIDLWIGTEPVRKSWIFGRQPSAEQATEYVWRHANLGALRCVIHANIPADAETADLAWCGEKDAPFTRALSHQVASLMSDGVPLQHICALLDVAVEELWKFRHRLDKGKSGLLGEGHGAPAAAAPADPDSAVPGPEDPVWQALLVGAVRIDIRVLSLKLFLAKLREQAQSITDEEVIALKCHELQRFFVRNEKYLGQELAQLRNH